MPDEGFQETVPAALGASGTRSRGAKAGLLPQPRPIGAHPWKNDEEVGFVRKALGPVVQDAPRGRAMTGGFRRKCG